MLNIENIPVSNHPILMELHQTVDLVVIVVLIDYVVQAVATFAPNLVNHSMERIHYVKLEMVIEIVVEVENNNFDQLKGK